MVISCVERLKKVRLYQLNSWHSLRLIGYNTFTMTYHSRSIAIVSQQLPLCPPLPRVIGPVEFDEFRLLWNHLDQVLAAGVEREFILRCVALKQKKRKRRMIIAEQVAYQNECRQALRCTLARKLLQESLRTFCCRLADSPVMQRFCLSGDLEAVRIPGHSQLQRYESWLPVAEMRAVITALTNQAQADDAPSTLGLEAPLSLSTVWVDSTCAETNIHYPVDWILLRDAVRTLIEAIMVLRSRGIRYRMPEPSSFLRKMNQLCIKMTHAGKGEKRKQCQKAILREMKELAHTVQGHATRYCALAEEMPEPRGWAVAAQRRMQAILEKLPQIIHQAHERIIGERQVPNSEKVLSIYEPDTSVLSRGKSGAQVEYGYSLFVAEQRDGLIVDWDMPRSPESDIVMLSAGVTRWQKAYGAHTIRVVVTDRGFYSKATCNTLKDAGIANGMCPRSPQQLAARLEEVEFRELQRRRSQTEGRIAIVKQTFLGGRLHTKGHAHQSAEMAWVIFAHNVWVIARLSILSKQKIAA